MFLISQFFVSNYQTLNESFVSFECEQPSEAFNQRIISESSGQLLNYRPVFL